MTTKKQGAILVFNELLKYMPDNEEIFLFNPASGAVADAMMATQAEILLEPLKKSASQTAEQIEKLLEDNSKNSCGKASVFALSFLTEKHSRLFNYMFLLTSFKTYESSFKNPDTDHHSFFVVQDKDGSWYAGSPANHVAGAKQEESPMTRIIKKSRLRDIISEIEKIEGGIWPEADYIENTLKASYSPPAVDKSCLKTPYFSYGVQGGVHFEQVLFEIPTGSVKPDLAKAA